jgi:hypothetical protein
VAEVTPSARRLRVASVLLGVFAAAVLVWMVGPIQDTADNTREVRRTTDAVNEAVTAIRDSADLTSCRAQMSAQIVGQAQDRSERAGRDYVAAIGEGLIAAGRSDDAALAAAADRLSDLLAEYLDAGLGLSRARDEYAAATAQAATDPDAFLAACRARNGPSQGD